MAHRSRAWGGGDATCRQGHTLMYHDSGRNKSSYSSFQRDIEASLKSAKKGKRRPRRKEKANNRPDFDASIPVWDRYIPEWETKIPGLNLSESAPALLFTNSSGWIHQSTLKPDSPQLKGRHNRRPTGVSFTDSFSRPPRARYTDLPRRDKKNYKGYISTTNLRPQDFHKSSKSKTQNVLPHVSSPMKFVGDTTCEATRDILSGELFFKAKNIVVVAKQDTLEWNSRMIETPNLGEWDSRSPAWERDVPFDPSEFSGIDPPKQSLGGILIDS